MKLFIKKMGMVATDFAVLNIIYLHYGLLNIVIALIVMQLPFGSFLQCAGR